MDYNVYQLHAVKTADGRPWCQNCLYCNKQIDLIKMRSGAEWIRVGQFVRHKKCSPTPCK